MNRHDEAQRLFRALASASQRIVFAESCTAGLVAASLAELRGASDYLCGSAVVYRETTKQQWLDVSAADLEQYTAVSQQVARQMALGVLAHTPEADLAASITGHLGPDAPPDVDGVVYVGIARQMEQRPPSVCVKRHVLEQRDRVARQQEAAALMLRSICELLHNEQQAKK